ncbi:MAG TPA: hypothetical protein VMV49_14990 [Candidatus Deferrimicrobium sp.]|nr:hypothetical protein [Candidatus Deferrimicrobium sp.]
MPGENLCNTTSISLIKAAPTSMKVVSLMAVACCSISACKSGG